MSIVTHNYSVYLVLVVFVMNFFILFRADDIVKFKRLMRILNPYSFISIGSVAFTGTVMMAAKHLDFTIENIFMIAISIVLIVLEAKRAKRLKYTNPKEENALQNYKDFAFKIFQIEVVLVLSMSTWMWMAL